MSDNEYDFGDIVAEAEKGGSASSSTTERLEGTFHMVAKYASGDRKTKAGHPQISIVWQVVGGPDADKETWHNIVFSPKSKGVAGRTLLELGFTPEYLRTLSGPGNFAQGLLDIADALVGVEVSLKIQPQSSNRDFDNYEIKELISGPVAGTVATTYTPPTISAMSSGQVGVSAAAYASAIGTPNVPVGGFVPQV